MSEEKDDSVDPDVMTFVDETSEVTPEMFEKALKFKPLKDGEIVFDEYKDMPFGVSGLDAVSPSPTAIAPDDTEPFEFTCGSRKYDPSMDAHHYHVDPVGEYGDLDFTGQIVTINGRSRLCDKFEIVDGKLILTVYCRA